jgi:pimeloyl-ACP methyl ester carboxylesterase
MRGYGGTEAPSDVEQYTMLHLVGDMVELVKALGESQAVIVGHDWGAPVAWNSALLRPDLFRAVVGMSVPFSPPGRVEFLEALAKRGIENFYMQYFQTPGVAEAELERTRNSCGALLHGRRRDAGARQGLARLPEGGGLLDNTSIRRRCRG